MSILRYVKRLDDLPDPQGSLSRVLRPKEIVEANRQVRADTAPQSKKRGPYNKYDDAERAAIGKYACQHGPAAASRRFSRLLGKSISENTVKSIKKAYKEEVRKRPREDPDVDFLPTNKRGRKVLLGKELDDKVQAYVKQVREGGGSVSSRLVIAGAKGIILASNCSLLSDYGGPVTLSRAWAQSLLQRMKFVKRKGTTAKSKTTPENFKQLKQDFLEEVQAIVEMEEIPAELVLNWDQTGIRIVPSSSWTMDRCGSKRVEIVGTDDKRQITALFCGTMLGEFLPIQLIYKGKTDRCHPKFQFPNDWDITHTPKHWSNEETMQRYIEKVIIPYVQRVRDDIGSDKTALVIMDNFKGQTTEAILDFLENNNILVSLLPPNTTGDLQPMDLSVNKPAKDYIKRCFEEWYASEIVKQLEESEDEEVSLQPVNLSFPVLKELGAKWLVGMEEYIQKNPSFIVNGFIHAGITAAFDGRVESESTPTSAGEDESGDSSYYDDSESDDDECDAD